MFNAVRAVLVAVVCSAISSQAFGQEYPNKTVRIIVPSSAGTLTDLVPRAITAEMSKILGQPVVIENRTGASGLIATEYVAKQVPSDGYTVLSANVVDLAIMPLVTKDLRFNAQTDLAAVIDIAEGYVVLVSSSKFPWKNFAEWVAYAKANPGKVNYGASIPTIRLPIVQLSQILGLDLFYVPYGAGGPYTQAILAGDVMGFLSELPILANLDKLVTIAVPASKRLPSLPNVPTFAELGYPNVGSTNVFALTVPTGTSGVVIERLNAAASKAMQTAEVRQHFDKIKAYPVGGTPQSSAKRLADLSNAYAEAARKAGIRPE